MNVIEPDTIDFSRYLEETEFQAKVHPAGRFLDDLTESLRRIGQEPEGDALPWSKTHANIRLRKGELSIWAGYNGHGKSMVLSQVMLALMAQERRALIASFEMKPAATLGRMLRQTAGNPTPPTTFARRFTDWASPRLWLFDHLGNINQKQALALCRYAHDELGIEHIVLDSMMKIVAAEDDFNAQKNFIGALHRFVQDSGVHVHLVHHSRKPDGHDGERRIPGRYDLKGSGAISDQADNVFCMWLDKTAINQQRQGNEDEPGKPHAILAVHKQRHGEFEGRVALWFDPGSMQFRAAPNAKPLEYLR